jgi:hypothetical protein
MEETWGKKLRKEGQGTTPPGDGFKELTGADGGGIIKKVYESQEIFHPDLRMSDECL